MNFAVNKIKVALPVVALIYLTTAIASAYTLLPNVDEAWFTIPGYNLAENGFFGTSTLEETANFRQVRLDGINQYTYWIMPLFPLTQAFWGKIVGFGLWQTRFVSVIFGMIALSAWFALIRMLTGNNRLAFIAVTVLAFDYHFIYAASLGRMDMMTAALGVSALAVFARWRGEYFSRAVFFSCFLAALAFFTHPLGLIWAVSLTLLIVFYDFKNLRIKHLIFAGAPFLILGACWSIYIFQRPDLFAVQFGGNASDRWGFFRAPLIELWSEIKLRYLVNFGIGDDLSRAGQIKIIVLVSYTVAVAAGFSINSLRKSKAWRFFLLVALQEFVMLLLLDGMKQHYYMIHIIPTLTVLLAFFTDWLLKNKKLQLPAIALLLVVSAIHLSVAFQRFKKDDYHNNYLPVAELLNRKIQKDETVMASSELWFGLNRRENLLDDYRLGYLTGKKADFIVMDKPRYKIWFGNLREREPEIFGFMENLLQNKYSIIYDEAIYQVYAGR